MRGCACHTDISLRYLSPDMQFTSAPISQESRSGVIRTSIHGLFFWTYRRDRYEDVEKSLPWEKRRRTFWMTAPLIRSCVRPSVKSTRHLRVRYPNKGFYKKPRSQEPSYAYTHPVLLLYWTSLTPFFRCGDGVPLRTRGRFNFKHWGGRLRDW